MIERNAPKRIVQVGLTSRQKTALKKAPPAEQIRTRREGGRELSYLEGWYVIAEANRIFGTENWDRVTLSTACVWQGRMDGSPGCTYTARVRIIVRAGAYTLVREGSGFGQARNETAGEAHGNALKIAETDATKRALATLGAPFGLLLYEHNPEPQIEKPVARKLQRGSQHEEGRNALRPIEGRSCADASEGGAQDKSAKPWIAFAATGEPLGAFRDPVLCCSSLRRAIESADSPAELETVFGANRHLLARLIAERPDLRSDADQHYSGILAALYRARLKRLAERNAVLAPDQDGAPASRLGGATPTSIKAALPIAEPGLDNLAAE